MRKHLQRILSILCVMALALTAVAALAEDPSVQYEDRVISIEWHDSNDYNKLRPAQVNVSLPGQLEAVAPLTAANGWTGQARVPATAENNWVYDVPEGYFATITRGVITTVRFYLNDPVAKPVTKSAQVIWEDDKNARGARPASVQLVLLANGADYGEPLTASSSNNWKVTWKNLPVREPNATEDIVYTVRQLQTPEGYTSTASGLEVTNTLLLGKLTLKASVTGAPDDADLSSFSLTVQGPDPSMPKTLSWAQIKDGTVDFGDVLPGAYLVLGISAEVEGYTMDGENSKISDAVMVNAGESASLTYKYAYKLPEATEAEEEYDPTAHKGDLTFEILGPDERMPMTVTYAEFTDGKYELPDLKPGTYAVFERNAETLVAYYVLTVDSVTGISLKVEAGETRIAKLFNKYTPAPTPEPDAEFVDIPVVKAWNDNGDKDGNRPESVTVRLYADGVEVDRHELTAGEGWKWTFTDLPRYKEDNKTEIVYTVNEDAVAMYSAAIEGYSIVNTYEPEVTSLSVSKTWVHGSNPEDKRPTSIYMQLIRKDNEEVITTVVLNAENGWTATVEDLPTVVDGQKVTYGWREQSIIGYRQENVQQDGSLVTFTNTYVEPEQPKKGGKVKQVGEPYYVIGDYDTALGLNVIINHVGDCFD